MKAGQAEEIRIDGHEIKLTRPDKVLFPDDNITKGDLVRYYRRIGPRMTPYLKGRPLALQRFPDGISEPGFFQKATAAYYPEWIPRVTVQKARGTLQQVVSADTAVLVYLANQACITPHAWLSRADMPHVADMMIFDLDPSTDDVGLVVDAAVALRDILENLSLPAYLKASGSRGLHIVTPLRRRDNLDAVREFARRVAEIVVDRAPAKFTLEQLRNKRRGRVFLDVNRNAYAQTAVAVYAVRARPGAPVSIPLDWSELRSPKFRSDAVTIRTVFERLDAIEDPWKDFWKRAVSLEPARHHL